MSGVQKCCGSQDMILDCHVISEDYAMKGSSDFIGRSPAKFGGHGQCGSGGIMILVCHVILQQHVIKGSCDFVSWSPSN